ncbi:MAG: uncharacterized protein JWN04_1755 [Myxococcaceae bacterium]|nr:uncharacterized protein [Myxococcaceae bacterium]
MITQTGVTQTGVTLTGVTQTGVTLTGLFVYPLKSARGIALPEAQLTDRGLAHDRRFMLVDPAGRFLTQRELPTMARLSTALHQPDASSGELELTFEGERLRVPLRPTVGAMRRVRVFGDELDALDLGVAAQQFLGRALRREASLVYMPEGTQRQVDPTRAKPGELVGFADGFPYLLANESSLAALNRELDDDVPMTRFRPNFVIAGVPAYSEDEFGELTIGGIPFVALKPCSRCVIVNTDQASGARAKGPLEGLLRSHTIGNRPMFGQNLVARSVGTVRVGDAVDLAPQS